MPTIEEKLADLRKTGIGEDKIAQMLTLPEKVKEEAAKLGISFKEIQDDEVTLLADTGNLDDADVIEVNGRTFKAFGPPKPKKAAVIDPMADVEPDPNDPNEPAEIAAGEPVDDAAMMDESAIEEDTGPDLEGVADAIAQRILTALGPALDLEKKLTGILDSIKNGATATLPVAATKEANLPYLDMVAQQHPQVNQDLITALQAIAEEVRGVKTKAAETEQKETEAAKEIATLKATIDASQKQLQDAQARLNALEGDIPTGIQPMLAGYRASQDGHTVAQKALSGPTDVQKPNENGSKPYIFDFVDGIIQGKPL